MNKQRWEQNFIDVCEYLTAHECALTEIPKDIRGQSGTLLYRWAMDMWKAYYGKSRYKLNDDQREKLREIGIEKIVSKTDEVWLSNLMILKKYFDEYHKTDVSKDITAVGGGLLSNWLNTQRLDYRSGEMKPERLTAFRENGLLDMLISPFERGYQRAVDYYDQHGHLNVPHDYVSPDGYKLGVWIVSVRNRFRQGNESAEHVAKLDKIGMIWNVKEFIWMQNYEACKAYYEQYGDLDIPDDMDGANGNNLKNWLSRCRSQRKKKMLTAEQEELLLAIHAFDRKRKISSTVNNDKIDAELSPSENEYPQAISKGQNISETSNDKILQKWKDHCLEVKQFYEINGHTSIPQDMLSAYGTQLLKWLISQRARLKSGKFTDEQIAFLHQNGIYELIETAHKRPTKRRSVSKKENPLSASEQRWRNNALLLKEFYNKNHHTQISKDILGDNGAVLAIWFMMQRSKLRSGQLSDDRITFLKELSILYLFEDAIIHDPTVKHIRVQCQSPKREQIWQQNCLELKAYCENNGTRTIPADVLTESGTQLKRWYEFNKMKYRNDELSDDKVDFLRSNDMLYLFERQLKKKPRPSQLRVKLSDTYYDKLMKIMETHDFSKEEAIERLIDSFENKPDT